MIANQQESWSQFFQVFDQLTDDDERARFTDLLNRNFVALGHPSGWAGIRDASTALQERLTKAWLEWALRDVDWLAVR